MDKIVFLHVPKTGGSSLAAALSKKYAAWEIFPWHHGGLDLFNPGDVMPFRFFYGHFRIYDLDYIPQPFKTLTLLREPRKRIESLYNYWRSYKKDAFPKYQPNHPPLAKAMGLRSFLMLGNPSLLHTIDNAMVRPYLPYPLRTRHGALAASVETILDDAMEALDKMTAFGFLERFDDTLTVMSAELGTPLTLPRDKVREFETLHSNGVHEVFEREPTSPEIDELLDSHTEIDRAFYERASKLFEAKFARHLQGEPAAAAAVPGAVLEWGDWINFGADFHLEGVSMDGWSEREDWGVWSITRAPSLRLGPLPETNGTIRLAVAARAAVFPTHPQQRVSVSLNGHAIESWEFAYDPETVRWTRILNVPSSALDDGGFLNLTFYVDRPLSLQTAGISDDSRELGLGLESIRIESYA